MSRVRRSKTFIYIRTPRRFLSANLGMCQVRHSDAARQAEFFRLHTDFRIRQAGGAVWCKRKRLVTSPHRCALPSVPQTHRPRLCRSGRGRREDGIRVRARLPIWTSPFRLTCRESNSRAILSDAVVGSDVCPNLDRTVLNLYILLSLLGRLWTTQEQQTRQFTIQSVITSEKWSANTAS